MTSPIVQTFPLGMHWPTVDPFLFCAHHNDSYPAGDERLAPVGSLKGRQIGQDFAGVDGWNMYHGSVVPGFPQHPHRGFETVTISLSGYIDHSDSLGATARFGPGDVQWMTAGGGIVHSEMFPLVNADGPNPAELFQIWLNLPKADKLVAPYFTMLWREQIPVVDHDGARVTVIAGSYGGEQPPPPPPNSWAAREEAEVVIWLVTLEPGAAWRLPAAQSNRATRSIFAYEGGGIELDGEPVAAGHGARIRCDREVTVTAEYASHCLVLGGRAIGEPVAHYGPFVMNDRAGLVQAVEDYQRTGFGGWPWPTDDPHHGRGEGRFAHHADGRVERR